MNISSTKLWLQDLWGIKGKMIKKKKLNPFKVNLLEIILTNICGPFLSTLSGQQYLFYYPYQYMWDPFEMKIDNAIRNGLGITEMKIVWSRH